MLDEMKKNGNKFLGEVVRGYEVAILFPPPEMVLPLVTLWITNQKEGWTREAAADLSIERASSHISGGERNPSIPLHELEVLAKWLGHEDEGVLKKLRNELQISNDDLLGLMGCFGDFILRVQCMRQLEKACDVLRKNPQLAKEIAKHLEE